MNTVTYTPAHPIVFLFDYDDQAMRVPVYDKNQVVSANDGCVSIRTISDVDGDVTVWLGNLMPIEAADGVEVFHGTVRSPNRKVAVVTSENQKLLEVPVQSNRADVVVRVDDAAFPSRIWIAVRG